MQTPKRLTSLSDLQELLPETKTPQLSQSPAPKKLGHDGKGKTVHVTLDSKGRKGKTVTVIAGFQHNPTTMDDIARILKQHCGAGGTVKGMTIEIQGDQRGRVTEKLQELNYIVK